MKKCSFLTVLACVLLASTLLISACGKVDSGAEEPTPKIVSPYISEQPESHSYYIGGSFTAPPLTAKILEWNKKDGVLSYQWFKFDDIQKYFEDRGGTPIGEEKVIDYNDDTAFVPDGETDGIGDITLTYTPDNITNPQDRAQFYYYVVITNKRGKDTASVQSEVAAISFSETGKPLFPIIVTNPVGATYEWGAAMNDLKIRAKKAANDTAGGTLSYKWYTVSTEKNADGEYDISESEGDTDDRLVIDFKKHKLKLYENVFIAMVSNTAGSDERTAVSIPAILNIKPGRRAAAPLITKQPKDGLYFTGDTIAPLTVAGESTDNGIITYQWYSNTENSNKGGTAVSGANAASFTPPSTSTARFYYAVLTNTNDNVTGTKTATANSVQARISVGSPSDLADLDVNVFMSIPDPNQSNNRFQYIRGYGGMDVGWGNFPRTTQADTELMYDPNRMGYNMLRIMIRADYTDPAETINYLLSGDRPDYYENVKIVNKYGGYVAASPWTPPKDWKSNNSINGGGVLIPKYYPLFAQYLRKFAQNMADNGAPIYCISISNEPNYVAGYDGCEWTPKEAAEFFEQQGHFTTIPTAIRGWGGGQETPFVLVMNGESANTPYYNLEVLQSPVAKANVDVLARHIYGERTVSLWNDYPDLLVKHDPEGQNKGRLEVWMTEHNINSANATGYYNDSRWDYVWRYLNDVDLSMRMNNENAFVWWASKRFYSMIGDGQFGTVDGAPLPRGWALSHYARFTIGMTRIKIGLTAGKTSKMKSGTTITASGVMKGTDEVTYNVLNNNTDDMDNDRARVTAYISEDQKEISLVMWTPTKTNGGGGQTMGTVRIDLPTYASPSGATMRFKVTGATAVRSWGDRANRLFQPYDIKLNTNRSAVFVDVDKSNIVSVKLTGEWVND